MSYQFSTTSQKRLEGVHPVLIQTAERVLSYGVIDLTIPPFGGLRTLNDQRGLVKKGVSKTLNSMHLPQNDGYGHAIDVIPYPVNWNDIERFKLVGHLMMHAAREIGFVLEWGGNWKTFKDYPHFQLPREAS